MEDLGNIKIEIKIEHRSVALVSLGSYTSVRSLLEFQSRWRDVKNNLKCFSIPLGIILKLAYIRVVRLYMQQNK